MFVGGGGCVEKPGVTVGATLEGCVIGVGAAGVPNLSPGVLPSLLPPDGAFGMSRVEGDLRALPMAMLSKGSLLSFFSEKMVQTTGLEGNQDYLQQRFDTTSIEFKFFNIHLKAN